MSAVTACELLSACERTRDKEFAISDNCPLSCRIDLRTDAISIDVLSDDLTPVSRLLDTSCLSSVRERDKPSKVDCKVCNVVVACGKQVIDH